MSAPGTDPWGVSTGAAQADVDPWATQGAALQDSPYLPMIEGLEASDAAARAQSQRTGKPVTADGVLSPKGAVGRYQIMPATAAQYGLDPAKLTDPAYNRMAANLVLQDLDARYKGDKSAIAVAYNAGPGAADRWIKANRDLAVLPAETRAYLERATDPWAPNWTASNEKDGLQQVSGPAAQHQAEILSGMPHGVQPRMAETASAFGDKKAKASAPAKPDTTWTDAFDLMKLGRVSWDAAKKTALGLAEAAFNQDPTKAAQDIIPGVLSNPFAKSWLSPEQQKAADAARAPVTAWFAKARADVVQDIKANTPELDPLSAKGVVYNATTGLIQMAPIIAATVLTKNPAIGAGLIAGQVGGERYAESLNAGRSHEQASMDATFSAMVNGGLGLLPLKVLMKPGGGFLTKTLRNAGAFGTQSVATEALQIGYDMGLIDPNMTLKQAWPRIEAAGITGVLTGALIGGGHAGLESAVARFRAAAPPTPRVEPTAATAAPPEPSGAQAAMAKTLGLERPGVAPTVPAETISGGKGPLVPSSPPRIAQEHALEVARLEREGAEAALRGRPPVPSMEGPAAPHPEAARPEGAGVPRRDLEADTAITPSGREVPVRYAVVEASHLVPSQDQTGNPNPHFPAELQPRDRARAVSQAQVASIAQNINPRLLDRSANAGDGAPIIAPSGVVESGNGRSLAIQRAYAQDLPSASRYRDYLAQQGYPVEGMTAPVLVRVREGELSPEERQSFVREANQPSQMGYSATERAMSDASSLPSTVLDLYRGGDVEQAGNRDFVRAFMRSAVPANEHAGMIDAHGGLSQEAVRRVRAALLAKAYGDPDLVGSVVESPDSNTKAIGGALTDVAADWARMRAMAANGDIPPALDQTGKLLEAVNLVAHARAEGRNIAEYVGQADIFTGQAIDPDVEAWLRLMFRNTKDWTQPVGRDRLAEALGFYAREAQKFQAGQNLLGLAPTAPRDVLALARERQYGQRTAQAGSSLPLGEDVRAYGGQGAGPGAEGAAPGRGEGFAQAGPEAAGGESLSRGTFGRAPTEFDFEHHATSRFEGGAAADITGEFDRFSASVPPGPEKFHTAAQYVADRGRRLGTESFVAIGDGAFAATSNDNSSVTFSPALVEALGNPAARIVSVHNHPSSGSFSKGDLGALSLRGHAGMVVIGHDGTFYSAKLAARPLAGKEQVETALHDLHQRARDAVKEVIDRHIFKKIRIGEANRLFYHAVNSALDAAGVTDYMSSRVVDPAHEGIFEEAVRHAARTVAFRADDGNALRRDPARRDAAYRRAEPVRADDGIGRFLESVGPLAGYPGGTGGAPASAPVYRRAQQLRLLEEENAYEESRGPFYSALTRSIEESKLTRAPAKDWSGLIGNLRNKGIKQEEIDWSGVKDWLASQAGPVSKDQVLQHLRENEVQVQEVLKGGPGKRASEGEVRMRAEDLAGHDGQLWGRLGTNGRQHYLDRAAAELDRGGTKFASYTLPGGENYRELLLTLPHRPLAEHEIEIKAKEIATAEGESWDDMGHARRNLMRSHARSVLERGAGTFISGHFTEPNVLAHVRFDDRTGPNGEKVLHIAEIQSDLHQKGRREGYVEPKAKARLDRAVSESNEAARRLTYLEQDRTKWSNNPNLSRVDNLNARAALDKRIEAARAEWQKWADERAAAEREPSARGTVPNAPFKASWHELALKRILRYAAEHGYDKISWDTGETQAERYDLSKQVDGIFWHRRADGTYNVTIHVKEDADNPITRDRQTPQQLAELIGKDAADKIASDKGEHLPHLAKGESVGELKGNDLKVGGEGMKGFYDRIIPQFLAKYAKKWGAAVARGEMDVGKEAPATWTEAQTGTKKGEGRVPVHELVITPAMRESVMRGQALFEEKPPYKEEPGAVDAQGRPLPQTIIPGAEATARQLAAAREAVGKGLKTTKAAQKEAGPLFAPGEGGKQGSLFEEKPPYGFAEPPRYGTRRPFANFKDTVKRAADNVMDVTRDLQMLTTPMARGAPQARADAKDFANMGRVARDHGQIMDRLLTKKFSAGQRKKMWDAADEESVALQKGQNDISGIGLARLTPEERRAVQEQQQDAQNTWDAAKDQRMVSGNGLPSYMPRMMVEIANTGYRPLGSDAAARSVPGIGRNLRTRTAQMLHRKHLTAEETEAAGSRATGTEAHIVRDIRTLPLATARLREAVAGRALINKIEEAGRKTGEETVVEGHDPSTPGQHWFHLNHPAFFNWRPKFIKDELTGEWTPAKDQNGDTVLEKTPLYVRGDYEGPLKAVLSRDTGKAYQALMTLKGKTMTTIMFSPLVQLHLLTEIGRAAPTFPLKIMTAKLFFEGNAAKKDPALRTEAIMHGMVPIGHQGAMQDISSIAQGENLQPGRSLTAHILGAVPGWLDPRAGDAVKRAIDMAGNVLHNGLLWDRVSDLQFGLYTNFRDSLLKKGFKPETARYMAAHFANRYAGTLPPEAMSSMARKISNLMLFSRTYTLGNIGVLKDMLTGLPLDVQAQIERDAGTADLKKAVSYSRKKTASVLALDTALSYGATALFAGALAYWAGRQDLTEIEKGYVDRWNRLKDLAARDPLAILNPFTDLDALSPTAENETDPATGKPLFRILVGYDKQGTAIYARNPLGKFAEEYRNWAIAPGETAKSKLSPYAKPTWDVIANDRGFGRRIYNPTDSIATALGKIAMHYIEAQVPMDQLTAARDLLMGKTKELDAARIAGRTVGLTFRRGAPGGPAVGAMYQLQRERDARVSEAMPGIVEKIKGGDIQGARADMKALGMDPRLINWYVRTTLNPKLKIQTRRMRELLRSATPEERARIEQLKGAQP